MEAETNKVKTLIGHKTILNVPIICACCNKILSVQIDFDEVTPDKLVTIICPYCEHEYKDCTRKISDLYDCPNISINPKPFD